MKEYRDIENTRYVISRVFANSKTTAMLIEQQVKNIQNHAPSLTSDSAVIYNMDSGSVQSKEGL